MFLYKQSRQINSYLEYLKDEGKTLGFVPTMGALHAGHLSLIQMALERADIVICSIFVNPTQFDQEDDYLKYPQTLPEDLKKLEAAGCHIAFAPTVSEIYPDGEQAYRLEIEMSDWTNKLEGTYRPGHFEGMMQVVARLLEIVPANYLLMGQKDYQQWSIVQEMVSRLGMQTEVLRHPIVREEDGLAMSSRNRRISPELRGQANTLYKVLSYARDHYLQSIREEGATEPLSPNQLAEKCRHMIEKSSFKLEYFELVDGSNLRPVENFDDPSSVVALTAGWLGDVRLIDNMILKH